MPNRLADAVSPYLRSHADNPVDWQQWGSEPFAEAAQRQVPILISIGYSTCHWCHGMARESFSDPELAAFLNEKFVSIKVDREEHPDVDSSYLAAAGAFTDQLGWPLNVFATPEGRAFFAGTYFPPVTTRGMPSFRTILDAVLEAWNDRRDGVEDSAARLVAALAQPREVGGGDLPGKAELAAVVAELTRCEDPANGGFGGAPKFPVAPVLGFLLDRADAGDDAAAGLAGRTLDAMAASPLRDPIEGGFFRYATRPDWSEPHYERMLYDNAQLLTAYTRAGRHDIAFGIADFLTYGLRLANGGFASAQDSESTVDDQRVEGGYYRLDAVGRAQQTPPALDEKVLTGWNGLAIGALAFAGSRFGNSGWIEVATAAADLVAAGELVRARIGDRVSSARPTLEDFGMLADGLLDLALATGEVRFATRALELVEESLTADGFAVPGGADPVLVQHGLLIASDPSEGAYPSGLSAISRAAIRLALLGAGTTARPGLRDAAEWAMAPVAELAIQRPIAFGAALGVLSALSEPRRQLVVVSESPSSELVRVALAWAGGLVAIVTPTQSAAFAAAGFELFESRGQSDGKPTAYLCDNFVCQLPVTEAAQLEELLAR
jgi:uncharacterized protein YyaL (SSP411 family)